MGGVGEFEERAPPFVPPTSKPPAPEGGPSTGPSGGPSTEPSTGPTPPPEGSGPKPEPTPEPRMLDPGALARQAFAALVDWEKGNASDLPALQAAWEKFLSDHPDPALPEYTKAALRLGDVTDRMRSAYKEVTENDPDGIDNVDSKEVGMVVTRLTSDLNGKDPEARRRAARLLGDLATGLASFSLAKTLRDDDTELRTLCQQGLVKIGGPRTAYQLVKLYRDSSHENQVAALEVLQGIARKGRADARTVSRDLGRFALSNDQDVAGAAIDFLVSVGPPGGPGLVEALETRIPLKKIELIKAIGTVRYYAGAPDVAEYLLPGDHPNTVAYRKAAIESLKGMGVYAVPYLIPKLRSRQRQWAALVLRDITGEPFGFNDAKKVRAWYERNKPADAPDAGKDD